MLLGIVGGLGPRASAAFVSTIYDLQTSETEQHYPRLLLYSDPTFADRTSAFLAGETASVQSALERVLIALLDLGATHLVACCFTIHHIVDALPPRLQEPLVRLPDVAAQVLAASSDRALMLCTTGCQKLGVFERAALWPEVSGRVAWPTVLDQGTVHDLLYELKQGLHPSVAYAEIADLCRDYECAAAICGCTEMHLVSRWWQLEAGGVGETRLIDPLWQIAVALGRGQVPGSAAVPAAVLA